MAETDTEQAERELRIELMTTQIEHYRQQIRWEPWKVVTLSIGAGAALMGAAVALATIVLGSLHGG